MARCVKASDFYWGGVRYKSDHPTQCTHKEKYLNSPTEGSEKPYPQNPYPPREYSGAASKLKLKKNFALRAWVSLYFTLTFLYIFFNLVAY